MAEPDFYSGTEDETQKTVRRYQELGREIEKLYEAWESAVG